jgi:hypothetical protein
MAGAMGANSDAATSTERSLGNDGAGNNAEGGSAHYTDVAVKYESAFFYSSPDYRDWVMKHLLCHFGLPHEVVARGVAALQCSQPSPAHSRTQVRLTTHS